MATSLIETVALEANSLVGALVYRHFIHKVRGYSLAFADRTRTPTLLDKIKSVDFAFMGLGHLDNDPERGNWLDDIPKKFGLGLEISQSDAVGDILYHLVNQDGASVPLEELDGLFYGLQLRDLKQMIQQEKKVVVIASGEQKIEIAQTCLRGEYANVFVIDDELAQGLLK